MARRVMKTTVSPVASHAVPGIEGGVEGRQAQHLRGRTRVSEWRCQGGQMINNTVGWVALCR